ncbi:MAG: hypothetical protein IKP88_02015 [Lachnospiraceae bacterium]|nr:hypothetical protein [Lachnospiraceae bacterium]
MGQLIMIQKALALKESYEVYLDNELKYFIKKRKLLKTKPAYDISTENGVVATAEVISATSPLIYKLTFGDKDFGEVCYKEVPGVNKLTFTEKGLEIDGNSNLNEFTVKDRDKKIIGTVKKTIVSIKDTYEINYINDSDELLFAIIGLLIDETFHG